MVILYVIIYLIIDYKFQNNGKMNNIKIHKKIKMVIQKQCNVL